MKSNFKSKGLQRFFETGDKRGIQPEHARKLSSILGLLAVSTKPEDMQLPGLGLHQLRGNFVGFYAVKISGNWRVVFRFEEGRAVDIDLIDYH